MPITLEAHHELILSSLSSGVMVIDLASKVVYVNDAGCEMLQEPGESLVGGSLLTKPGLFAFIPVINEHRKVNPSLAVSGRQVEATIKDSSGNELPVGCSITNLTDEEDVVLGYVIVFRDLTEMNRLKAVAKRSEHLAALGTMAAGVAHEIRNPLHAIRASVELTQLKIKKDKPVDEYLKIILKEVGRLNDIVGDILSFSRNTPLKFEMTDMKQYIDESKPIFALPDEVELVVNIEPTAPQVPLDKAKFLQVLLNIVRNAAEAMHGTGCIQINTEVKNLPEYVLFDNILSDAFLCLSIVDEGPGMNEETIAHIFEPFYSFGKPTKGTGLGLPICQKIIEAHYGAIEVQSQPGKGSVFSIYLPVRTTFSLGISST